MRGNLCELPWQLLICDRDFFLLLEKISVFKEFADGADALSVLVTGERVKVKNSWWSVHSFDPIAPIQERLDVGFRISIPDNIIWETNYNEGPMNALIYVVIAVFI